MKYSAILFLLLITDSFCIAQRKADIGITGGTSYYQGDINPAKLFYKPRYNVGPIVRFNINTRYSIRLKAVYASIAGSDADFNYFITKRNPVTFSAQFINISSQVEYNFFKYTSGITSGDWTPYMFGGFGYSFVFSSGVAGSDIQSARHLSMPFGIGAKANVTRRLSAGLEWSYNKTFNDRLDGVITPINQKKETKFYNNDWYSFFNLFITYKFFKFAPDCPAYD
jgi:opacity protein-like surface antigen